MMHFTCLQSSVTLLPGGSYAERFDNRSHFYSEYNSRWTDVKDASTMKSYRVILGASFNCVTSGVSFTPDFQINAV